MQITSTFPELSAGRSKGKPKKPAMKKPSATSSFSVAGRGPRKLPTNASTFSGRRAAAYAKAKA